MRRIVYVIVIAAVLAAAAYTALFVIYPRFEADPFSYDDTLKTGVKMPVRIDRDGNGIPVISTEDMNDMYLALGYVHAQDRSNIMEYYRAIATGFPDRVIDGDDGKMLRRLVCILSLENKADDLYSGLTTESRAFLDSYVNGINTWIARRGHRKGMRGIPVDRPWKAADVIAIHLLREWADSYLSNNELVFPLTDKKMRDYLNDFFPRDYVTVYNEKYQPYVNLLRYLRGAVKRCLGEDSESFSMFAPPSGNDPSRLLMNYERVEKVFPLRYPVRFSVGKMKYSAVSEAGLPFLKAVISDNASYSIMQARLDSMDFYLIEVEKVDGVYRYNYGGRYSDFEVVKTASGKEEFSFRKTEFGPVISDMIPLENESICIVTDPLRVTSGDIDTLLAVPFYGSMAQMRNALASLQGYPKSVLVASENNAVSFLAGTIPVRRVKGVMFHDYPASGMMNLSSYGQSSGNPVLASSRIAGDTIPALRDYAVSGMSEKENACIASMKAGLNIASFMKVINSSESPSRERLSLAFDRFLVNMPVTSAKLSRIYLSEWKGEYSGKAIAPTIMQQLYFSMIDETLGDELGNESDLLHEYPEMVYDRLSGILEKGNSAAFDNVTTSGEVESMGKVFNNAFIKAMRMLHRHYGPEMGKWRWDRVGMPVYEIPFESNSRFTFGSDSHYNDMIHYESDVSYSGKNDVMASTAISVSSLMKWGDTYWGGNFPVSSREGSEYYGNALINRRMIPFDDGVSGTSAHTVRIIPDSSVVNK